MSWYCDSHQLRQMIRQLALNTPFVRAQSRNWSISRSMRASSTQEIVASRDRTRNCRAARRAHLGDAVIRAPEEIGQRVLTILKPRPSEVLAVEFDQIEGQSTAAWSRSR